MPDELIRIRGIDEVCAFLDRIPKDNLPGALLSGLDAGGKVLSEFLVGTTMAHERTGKLMADLDTVIQLDYNGQGGVAMVGFSKSQAYKALWLEYGHRMVGHKPNKKDLGAFAPRPFMRVAADAGAEEAIDAFVDAVLSSLDEQGVVTDAA